MNTNKAETAQAGGIRVSHHGENCILMDDRGWVTGSIRPGCADEIARRCNSHADLLAALRACEAALHAVSQDPGDVPEWNEDGEYYEASHKAAKALARATK